MATCETAEHGYGRQDFKETILLVCKSRGDAAADQVCARLQGCISDLHAADAIYRKDCSSSFMAPKSIKIAIAHGASASESDPAFNIVVNVLQSDRSRIWNYVDIYKVYVANGGCFLLRRTLIVKLNTYFAKDLLILSGNGVASILIFHSKASSVLQVVDDDEDDLNESITKVAKTIAVECKQLKQDGKSYQTRIAPDSITADKSLVMGREQMETLSHLGLRGFTEPLVKRLL